MTSQSLYLHQILNPPIFACLELSLLYSYSRLFPSREGRFRARLYIVATFVAGCYVAEQALALGGCTLSRKAWKARLLRRCVEPAVRIVCTIPFHVVPVTFVLTLPVSKLLRPRKNALLLLLLAFVR